MRGLLSPLVKLTIFLVITAFATYVLGATIANTSYGSTTTYRADFTDANGLQLGDDIRVAGVRVGSVSGIKLVRHVGDNGRTESFARVTFTVIKSRPLPATTQATLRYRNLVGQRYIDISQGAGASNVMLKKDALIPYTQTHPALDLTTLFAGFQPLFQGLDAGQINDLSTEIIQSLQGEGGSIQQLLSTLADVTSTIADKDQVIGSVVDNLSSVLSAVGSHDTELSDLIVQLQRFVSGLAADRNTIGNSIDGINALATSTAGLLTQIRAPLKQDVTDLSALTANLYKGKGDLTYVVQQLPGTVGALIRTASYGSWFNFYLCQASGTLTLPGGSTLDIPVVQSKQARCQG
jgi:phospholipid/cholesterol/gamma-HCH transport system substrate-binding protein